MQNNQHPDFNPSIQFSRHRETKPLYAVSQDGHDQQLPGTHNQPPERAQVTSPEEVLAYIQCTLGFRPSNSLLVVAFADNRLSTVVRCDVPDTLQNMLRSDTPEGVTFMDFGLTESTELQLIGIGRHIGRLMAKEPSTTSCVLIYLTDDVTVSDQQALSVAGTANSVVGAQFGLQQVPVEESWLIHHDMLWHLRCAATTDCDVQGDDVGNPEETAIFRVLDPDGKTTKEHQLTARPLIFPPASSSALQAAPDTQTSTQTLLEQRPQVVINWLKLWDENLHSGPTMLHSAQVAQLLAALEHPRIREAILALACFDFTTAIRGMVTLGQFPPQLAHMTQLQTNLMDAITVKDCMTGDSERAPDWQRIGELERLCHQLLPLSDGLSGGVVAGLLVWIEWVRGRGSIAMRYVEQARKRFPAEQFLVTLEGFLRQGLVAGWATRMESAWSPQRAA